MSHEIVYHFYKMLIGNTWGTLEIVVALNVMLQKKV